MTEMECPQASGLTDAVSQFADEVARWARDCIGRHGNEPPTDGHDQMTYATSWSTVPELRDDLRVTGFLTCMRDRVADHFTECGTWRHGYWRMNEAHHGTEHTELFLGMLADLDPTDPGTVGQIVGVAEHVGNWSDAVDPWFDWDTGLFRSTHFGADGVDLVRGTDVNVPDHFRCVNIALLAHSVTRDERYLDLADTHARRWRDAILMYDALPIALTSNGPIASFDGDSLGKYRRFAGQSPRESDDVARAENLLASGAITTLLRLAQQRPGTAYLQAAERVLDVVSTQLADPDAGCAADAVRTYRDMTGSARYDQHVVDAVKPEMRAQPRTVAIKPVVSRSSRPPGIGKRQDMPEWQVDGRARRVHPITHMLAAEITGDPEAMAAAVVMSRACFLLALESYPDGRDHGCSARSVSAIARGHGRENGAGLVTAVLGPAVARTAEAYGHNHDAAHQDLDRCS